jgi:hypothetical protein
MRIRLHSRTISMSGDIVDLPDGVEGPHGSRQVSHDRIDYDPANGLDANRLLGKVKRVPLFDIIEEDDMLGNRPALPTTLADRPVAERRGDDLLDRGAHHVAHPADLEVAKAWSRRRQRLMPSRRRPRATPGRSRRRTMTRR